MSDPGTADGYQAVARYEAAADAQAAAEKLLVRGIGAMIDRQVDDVAEHVLLVVPADAERAREILGIGTPEDPDAPIGRPAKSNAFWIAIVFLAAMILLPLFAFFVSFKLAGG